LWM
ncbi:ATP-dependent protease La Type II domain protein, partial [Vibrio harveyi]